MKLPKLYQIGHFVGGALIGFAGLAGLPAAAFVLTREYWQEVDTSTPGKPKKNIAWHDLTEWAGGALLGVFLRLCITSDCSPLALLDAL